MQNPQQRKHRKRRSSFLLFLLLIPLVMLLAGEVLAAGEDVLYKGPRPMKETFQAEQDATGAGGQLAYFYNPVGKTDPFKSFIAEPEEMGSKKERKPRTYLETLDLSQLQLIAIMVGPKGRYAMVREAKGLGHVIQKGTAIGRNGGVVESITESTVTIREEYRDFRGQTQYKEVKKTLDSGIK